MHHLTPQKYFNTQLIAFIPMPDPYSMAYLGQTLVNKGGLRFELQFLRQNVK
jgi:hypothetical protein